MKSINASSAKQQAFSLLAAGSALTRLALAVMLGSATVGNCQPYSPRVKDLPVETFDTGLLMIRPLSIPYWINNDEVLITAVQDGKKATFSQIDTPAKTVIANFSKREIRTVAEDGNVVNFDRYSKHFMLAKLRDTDIPDPRQGASATKTLYLDLRELSVKNDGRIEIERRYPEGSEPPDDIGVLPKNVPRRSLGHPKDGYLINVVKEGDTLLKQGERNRLSDEPEATAWFRAGEPLIPIPVRFEEISDGLYVEFLDKFQLNVGDSAMSSHTNRAMSASWARPYDLTPYRLLSRDGTIEEIPYPSFIKEFGLEERRTDNEPGRVNFSSLLFTKPGILIRKNLEDGGDYFLYKGQQVYRLIAHSSSLTSSAWFRIRPNRVIFETLSPNGCRLAYTHIKASTSGVTRSPDFYLTIIDLCTPSSSK